MPSKCSYINCNLSYYNKPEGIRLYRFPVDDRATQWIINSGNLSLFKLPPKTLRGRVICQRHFTDDSFVIGCTNYRLNASAVPVKHAKPQISPPDLLSSVIPGTVTSDPDGSENVNDVSDIHLTTKDIIQYTNTTSRNIHAKAVKAFEKVLNYVESQHETTPADIVLFQKWLDIATAKSISFHENQKRRQNACKKIKLETKNSEVSYTGERRNRRNSQGLGETIYIKHEPITKLENEMQDVDEEVFPEHFLSNFQSSEQFSVIKQEPSGTKPEKDNGF